MKRAYLAYALIFRFFSDLKKTTTPFSLASVKNREKKNHAYQNHPSIFKTYYFLHRILIDNPTHVKRKD